MALFIQDIFQLVCKEIPIHRIVKFELISKFHDNIIKTNEWYHSEIIIKKADLMEHIINKYKFYNLNMKISEQDKYLTYLEKCHTLNLELSILSDKNIRKLHGCHTLNLANIWNHLKHKTLKKLKYCHTLILFDTWFDTNGLKFLGGCHILCLTFSYICDVSIKYLQGCHTLGLEGTYVTNNCIKYLTKCHTLYFSANIKIDGKHRNILRENCCSVHFNSIYA
jgi:hypothetical protein